VCPQLRQVSVICPRRFSSSGNTLAGSFSGRRSRRSRRPVPWREPVRPPGLDLPLAALLGDAPRPSRLELFTQFRQALPGSSPWLRCPATPPRHRDCLYGRFRFAHLPSCEYSSPCPLLPRVCGSARTRSRHGTLSLASVAMGEVCQASRILSLHRCLAYPASISPSCGTVLDRATRRGS